MNAPTRFPPDPQLVAQVDEILRQNAAILKMNAELLRGLMCPVWIVPASEEPKP